MPGAMIVLAVLLCFVVYGAWRVRQDRNRHVAQGSDGGESGWMASATGSECDAGMDGGCGDGGGGGGD